MKGKFVFLLASTALGLNAAAQSQSDIASSDTTMFTAPAATAPVERQGFQTNFLRSDPSSPTGDVFAASIQKMPLQRTETSQTALSFRIDKIDQRNGQQRRGWYVFAGSDDEALTFASLTGADLELRDHVTIGDVHVGLSFPAGMGQAALGYSRRSVEYETKSLSATIEEDVLGLSYGLRF